MDAKKRKHILIGGIASVLVIIAISAVMLFYQNKLHQYEIVGVDNYPGAFPGDMKDELETQLRNVLALGFEVPETEIISGNIRDDNYTINESDDITTATFILDLDKYEQTYEVIMSWSDTEEVINGVLISCPEKELMKYPDAKCVAMYNNSQDVENIASNPIYDDLPIIVDEFDFASRASIHYEIRGYFNDDNELVIVINDYSGGNRENGLKKIRELGYNPDDYVIKYVSHWGK